MLVRDKGFVYWYFLNLNYILHFLVYTYPEVLNN